MLGGAGFVGSRVAAVLRAAGSDVVAVDRIPPPDELLQSGVRWIERDVLTEAGDLPDGHVVVALGSGNPRPRWTWTLPVDLAVTTARVAPALAGRDVTLVSSVEVYGAAPGRLAEGSAPVLPWTAEDLAACAGRLALAAREPCPPWRVAAECRRLADGDPAGRWVYGAAKLMQETIVRAAVAGGQLTVLRVANTFGVGQERVVVRMLRRALAHRDMQVTRTARSFLAVEDVGRAVAAGLGPGTFNLGGEPVRLEDLAAAILDVTASRSAVDVVPPAVSDSSGLVDTARLRAAGVEVEDVFAALPRLARELGVPRQLFRPSLPVVIPPRPARPDELADRQQELLWSGRVKHGNRWSRELTDRLTQRLALGAGRRLLLTTSGTDALRLAVVATAGPASPGDVAVVPSFTFPATAEAVAQLGYDVRFADVDPATWTLDAAALEEALDDGRARVVVAVDTFGNPADYGALRRVCRRHAAALVGDSAAALGASLDGRPIGSQADAHAFSMSFAKGLTAGGGGGAVVVPADADLGHWTRSKLMHELHAVSALDQLAVLDDLLDRRSRVARVYAEAAAALPDVSTQRPLAGAGHSHVHWVLRVPAPLRARFTEALAGLGIGTRDYFQALHRTGWPSDRPLEVTTRLHDEVVALPMSSELTVEDAERVAVGVEWALRAAAGRVRSTQAVQRRARPPGTPVAA